MVWPSSRRRKCRCFFHDRDLTFLRVDPAIITLTWGSSWIPAQRHVTSREDSTGSDDPAVTDSLNFCAIVNLQTTCNNITVRENNIHSRELSGSIVIPESFQGSMLLRGSRCEQMSPFYLFRRKHIFLKALYALKRSINTNSDSITFIFNCPQRVWWEHSQQHPDPITENFLSFWFVFMKSRFTLDRLYLKLKICF